MSASLEARVSRLESLRPEPLPNIRLLDPRGPFSWLPRNVHALTKTQSQIFLSPARFRVCVGGRRTGKSYLSVSELIRAARSGFDKLVWGVYPSYRLAKQTVWSALKSAVPPQWIAKKSEIELSLSLKGYGSTIALRSADNPDALRGSGLDFCVLDEFSNINPITWSEVIRPALADKKGGALILGSARGYNSLFDLYTQALETDGWEGFHFSTHAGGLVASEELALIQATIDEKVFAQEFLADFSLSTSRVYLWFDRKWNVRDDLQDLGGDVLVGVDFNISPLAAVVGQRVGDQLHVFDEVSLYNANTSDLAQELLRRYPGRRIRCFPDPTGRARKTSASHGVTDLSILEAAGLSVYAPKMPYSLADKHNTANALCCNANGQRRLFVHPRCRALIKALEQHQYKENSSQPDKSQNLEHHSDALAYLCLGEFPLIPSGLLTAEQLAAATAHPVAPYTPPPVEPEQSRAAVVKLTR